PPARHASGKKEPPRKKGRLALTFSSYCNKPALNGREASGAIKPRQTALLRQREHVDHVAAAGLVQVGTNLDGAVVEAAAGRHRDILPPRDAIGHRRSEHLRSQSRLPQHLAVALVEGAQIAIHRTVEQDAT